MYIAVEGCGHGELDGIYAAIQHVEKVRSIRVDLLIICGDFQATRNPDDLQCMAVPPKYYTMGTFYKYYCGQLTAPVLTLVVGGNHEASNYMQSLAHGGWLAPNIYFVGYASVLRFGSLRIGALSGIYNGHDYLKGHHERPPYDRSTMRSAYHVRNVDTFRLKQLTPEMDIFISHDWPRGVYHHGDVEQLLRKKPFFRDEVESNKLGSRPAEELLNRLQPRFWFAAHLHVKFSALVQHEPTAAAGDGSVANVGDTSGRGDVGAEKAAASGTAAAARTTRFLALDKCLPRRRYMQILELGDGPTELSYDLEWLTVLRTTDHLTSVSAAPQYMPGPGCGQRFDFRPTAEELAATTAAWGADLLVPRDFAVTAPPYDGHSDIRCGRQPAAATDPQTSRFCARLGVRDPMRLLCSGEAPARAPRLLALADPAQADITLDCDRTLDPDGGGDPAEIVLDEDEDEDEDAMFVIDRRGTSTPRTALTLPPIRQKAAAPDDSATVTGTSASPAVAPVTVVVTPASPAAAPVALAVTPASRGVTPVTLAVTPASPAVTPVTLAVTPASRDVTPVTVAVTPASPGVTPVTVADTPASPGVTPATPVVTSESAAPTPSQTPAKKFKRRNQAIYGAEADG